jgi:hypothetical protein
LQQCAFAGTGGTDDGERLSPFDLERDVVEDGQRICAGGRFVAPGDVGQC